MKKRKYVPPVVLPDEVSLHSLGTADADPAYVDGCPPFFSPEFAEECANCDPAPSS